MLAVQAALAEAEQNGARLLLQVHDELVLEVPRKDELDATSGTSCNESDGGGPFRWGFRCQVDVGVGGQLA